MTINKLPVLHITTSLIGELADSVAKDQGLTGWDQARLVRDSARLPPREAMDGLEKIISPLQPAAE